MLPNLNKKGRTASTQNIDPGIANKDKAQTIVPSIFVTIYPEFVQSFAPNRSITVNPDNLDDGATIQPMSEEVATNRPKLDKEGTRPSVPEDRTLAFKILHKEGTTKPFTLEEDITASKSLSEVTIAQSTVPEVKIKDSKMFSKEKVTMPPTDEDGTKGSQPLEKEGRTKSLVPEDSSVDSKLLNIEATTKSTIAENDTVNSEPLDNEGTKDTASEGSVTIHPKTTHFVSNRVISVHSDNLDNATKIQPIPPDDITIITPYINSEGTTKQIAPEGSGTIHSNKAEEEILSTIPEKYPTTYTEISQTESLNTATIFGLENLHIATTILSIPPDEAVTGLPNKNDGATPSKVFVKEGTTKSTIVEDSALNSESLDGEEMGATVPARYTSMHLEISESFAANKAISLDPHKSYNLATIQPTPEETTTILQYLTKVGKTQPSVVNGSSLKPNTPAEAETTFPKLDKGGTIKPTVHEDATDSKILEQDEMTKSNVPEKGHTIDSKVFDKEGRTKSIIAEDGALNSESLDHEETTIVPIESTTNYEGLTKAFYLEDGTMDSKLLDTGGRTKSTVDPTSRGKEATTKALDSEDDITNANMLDIQIAKAYVNQDVTIDSKALDNEGTTKPIIAEHGTMNSETLDSEETQTAASEGFTIVHPELEKLIIPNTAVTVDPDNLDNATQQAIPPENVATMLPHKEIEETTKPTVPEGHTTMLPDNVDKENMQFTVPEKYPTTYHGMSQSIPPNTASTLGAVRLGNATTIKSNTPEEAKTLFPKTDKEGTIKSVLPNYNNTDSKILDKTRLSNPIVPEEDPTADSRVLDKEGTTKPTPAEHSALNSKPMDIEKNPTVPEESTTEFKILDGEESTKAPVPEYGMMDSKPFDTEGTTKPTSEGSSTMDSDKVGIKEIETTVTEKHATTYTEISESLAPIRTTSLGNLEHATIQPISSEESITILPNLTKDKTAKLSTSEQHIMDSRSSDKEATTKPTTFEDNNTDSKSLDEDKITMVTVSEDGMIDYKSVEKDRTTKHTVPEDGSTNSKVFDRDGTTNFPTAEDSTINPETLDTKGAKPTVPEDTSSDSKTSHNQGFTKAYDPDYCSKSLEKEGITKADIIEDNSMAKEATTQPSTPDQGTKSKSLHKEVTTKSTVPEEDGTTDSHSSDKDVPTKLTVTEHGTMIAESLDNEIHTTASGRFTATYPEIPQSLVPNRDVTVDLDNLNNAATTQTENAARMFPYKDKEETTKVPERSETTLSDNLGKEEMRTTVSEERATMYFEILQSKNTTAQPISSEEPIPILPKLTGEGTAKPFTSEESTLDSKSSDKAAITKPTVSENNSDSKNLNHEETTMPTINDDGTIEFTSVNKDRTTKHTAPEDGSTDSNILDRDGTTNSPTAQDGTTNSENLDNEATKPAVPGDNIPDSESLDNEGLTKAYDSEYSSMDSKASDNEGITKADIIENNSKAKATTQPSTPDERTTKSKSLYKEVTTKSTVLEDDITNSYISDKEGPTKLTITKHGPMISESSDNEEIHTTASGRLIAIHPEITQSLAPRRNVTVDLDNLNNAETIQTIAPENAATMVPHKVREKTTTVPEGSETTLSENSDKEEMQTSVPEKRATIYFEISQSVARTSLGPDHLENTTTVQPISSEQPVTILPKLTKEATANLLTPEGGTLNSKSSDKEATTKPTITDDGTIESKSVDKDRTTKHTAEEDGSTDSNVSDSNGTTNSPTIAEGTSNSKTLGNEDARPTVPQDTSWDSKLLDNEGLTKGHDSEYSSMDFTSLEKEGITKLHANEDESMVKEATTQPTNPGEVTTKSKLLYKELTAKHTVPEEDVTTDSYFLDKDRPTKPIITEHGPMISESLDNEEIHTTASGQFTAIHPEIPQSLVPDRAVTVDPDNLNNAATIQTFAPENATKMLTYKDKEGTVKVPEGFETTLSDNLDKEEMQTSIPEKSATRNSETIQPISSKEPVTILPKLTEGTAKLLTLEIMLVSESSDKESKPTVSENNNTESKSLHKEETKPTITDDGTIESQSVDEDRTTKHTVQEDGSTDSNVLDRDGPTNSPTAEDGTSNSKTLDNEAAKPTVPEDIIPDSKILGNEGLTKAYDPEYSSMDSKSLQKEGITKPHVIEDGSMMIHPETAIHPEISESLIPSRAVTVDADNLNNAAKIQLIVHEDATSVLPHKYLERTTKVPEESSTTLSDNLNKEEMQTSVPGKHVTMYNGSLRPFALNRATSLGPANLENATTIPPVTSVEPPIIPNLNKEETDLFTSEDDTLDSKSPDKLVTTKPSTSEDNNTDFKSLNKDEITKAPVNEDGRIESITVPKYRITKPTDRQGDTKDSTILGKEGMSKPVVVEDDTMNSETLYNEETKLIVPEDTTSDSKPFDSEGSTKDYSTEYGTVTSKAFYKEGMTSPPNNDEDGMMDIEVTILPSIPKSGPADSKSLYREADTKPIVPKDNITDLKILVMKEMTMDPVKIDSKYLEKKWITKSIGLESGTTDSKFFDREGKTKPSFAKDSTVISESLDNEEIHTTASGGFTAKYPGISQSFVPNGAVTVGPDNIGNAETMQPIVPENAVKVLPHKDTEGKTKHPKPEGSATMSSLDVTKGEMQTTFPEKHVTVYHEISRSFALIRAISLGLDNLDKLTTIKFNTSEKDRTVLQQLDKNGMTNPTVLEEGHSTESKVLDKEGTMKSTTTDGGALNSKSLDSEEAKPEESTRDFKILDNRQLTKVSVPECGTMDSKPFNKEGTAMPTVSEGSATMDTDKAGKEKTQTTVHKKCAIVHLGISQTFVANKATSLGPRNLDDAPTIQPISPKEPATILPNLTKGGTIKLSTPRMHIMHSNSSNQYNNTDSKSLHKEVTTMTTIPEQTASLNPDEVDKKVMQTAAPEKSATTFLKISQMFSPNGPNLDKEKVTKPVVSEYFTPYSENINIGGSTKPAIAEDGTLISASFVNVETKTISPEESENVHLKFTDSFVPNRTVTKYYDTSLEQGEQYWRFQNGVMDRDKYYTVDPGTLHQVQRTYLPLAFNHISYP
eukprot:g48537.t1